MPAPQSPSAESFALEQLRADPELDYATLRQRANEAGIVLQPIHYGRARKQLGLTGKPPAGKPAPAPAPRAKQADEAPAEDAEDDTADADDADHAPEASPAKPAGRSKGSPMFDFALAQLRKDPAMSYAELRQRGEAAGYSLAPIVYGRAKAVLGLVPVKPRGKKAAATPATPAATALPLQLKQVESVAADRFSKQLDQVRSLEELVAVVKQLDAERRRLRDLLESIIRMADEGLGD